jgi:hypothetical protein
MVAWATLRQVVIGTTALDADVATVRRAFGLGAGFADPELRAHGLADATLPVAPGRYLEFVAPLGADGPVAGRLRTVGGRGGFVLSVQHPDAAGVLERCRARGVRVPVEETAMGKVVLQLHPKDVGLVLEVDGIAEPGQWFWDDVDPGPEPDAGIDAILGVEVPVADPAATAALWHELLELGAPVRPDEIDLGGTWVGFTPGGPSAEWTVVVRRSGPDAVDPGLPGVRFRVTSAPRRPVPSSSGTPRRRSPARELRTLNYRPFVC